MTKNKGIRVLCYMVMGISCYLSLSLIIYGCNAIVNEKTEWGLMLILTGIISPVVACLSLYPIYALSLIEARTSNLEEDLEEIIYLLEKISQPAAKPSQTITSTRTNYDDSTLVDAINFINQKYHIQIESTDNLNEIKREILGIDAEDNSITIFKERVVHAYSYKEIFDAIKMHYTIHKEF